MKTNILLGKKYCTDSNIYRVIKESPNHVLFRSEINLTTISVSKQNLINYDCIKPSGLLYIGKTYFDELPLARTNAIVVSYESQISNNAILLYSTFHNLMTFCVTNKVKSIYLAALADIKLAKRPRISTTINTYLDDTLDTILSLIGTKISKYDSICKNMCMIRSNENPNLYDNVRGEITKYDSLKEYLKQYRFWDEIDFINGISNEYRLEDIKDTEFDKEIIISPHDGFNIDKLVTSYYTYNRVCLRYWYDINLNAISKDHTLIRDKYDNLYVMVYDKGEVCNEALAKADLNQEDIRKFLYR